MDIDVSKCRFYIKKDGSCSSQDTDCTKCINCYCDWKVYQEQLQQLKQENEENHEQWVVSEQLLHRAEQKLEKIKEYIFQENKANRDLNENGDFIYSTILQIIKGDKFYE